MNAYKTYSEYLSHPRFRAVVNEAKARSGGQCEKLNGRGIRCDRNSVDPHHIAYCAWGEFDSVENLQMLCRECHENAHRCVRCGEVVLKAWHIKNGRNACCRCYTITR